MAIVKMKKLRMYAMQSEKDEILRDLQFMGCVEVSEQTEPEDGTDGIVAMSVRESGLADNKALFQRLSSALKALDKYAYIKSSLFTNRREVSVNDLLDESLPRRAMNSVEQVEQAEAQLMRLYSEQSKIESQIASLELWRELDVDLSVSDTASAVVQFGTIPPTRDIGALEAGLLTATSEFAVFPAGRDNQQQGLLIVFHKDAADDVAGELRKFAFNRVSFRDYVGTADENIKKLEKKLADVKKNTESILGSFESLGKGRDDIKLYYDRISQKIQTDEAAELLRETETVFCLTGWISAPEAARLETALKRFCCAYEITDPEENDVVPIKLNNNKLTEPLNMVTEMYSLPSYDGIDPNPLIMPFFTIFFGLMYNDAGYGLVLIIASLLVRSKMRLRGTMKYMMGLMTLCGVTSLASGLMTGSFFGDAIPTVAAMFGREVTLPYLFSPLDDPLMVLIGALAIGFVQIIVGMAIKAYMLIRGGQLKDAIFDVGSWWLLFAGIAVLAVGGTYWVALAGVAALVLTQGRSKPTIAGKIIGGLASLYDITAYFGDVLSYSRLMALMLAGGVVATVVNMLGALPGNIFVYIIIFLVGHVFNMGINIIGTYVHAARLQYLEYFGKFYKDGGKPFKPLALKTKYVDIIKEEN